MAGASWRISDLRPYIQDRAPLSNSLSRNPADFLPSNRIRRRVALKWPDPFEMPEDAREDGRLPEIKIDRAFLALIRPDFSWLI
jgi:hypothetical protein